MSTVVPLKCWVFIKYQRQNPISYKQCVFTMFVIWPSPYHTPIKYKCMIKKDNQITHAHLRISDSQVRSSLTHLGNCQVGQLVQPLDPWEIEINTLKLVLYNIHHQSIWFVLQSLGGNSRGCHMTLNVAWWIAKTTLICMAPTSGDLEVGMGS